MRNKIPFLLLSWVLIACDANTVHSEFQSLPNGWHKDQDIVFEFKEPDTLNTYDVYVWTRNNEQYSCSNVFLLVEMRFPDGKVVSDTLEYAMAEPSGKWLGKGFSAVKESKLWYKEGVHFPIQGTYKMLIRHAMRKNGENDGIENLEGIIDLGISIEKQSQHNK